MSSHQTAIKLFGSDGSPMAELLAKEGWEVFVNEIDPFELTPMAAALVPRKLKVKPSGMFAAKPSSSPGKKDVSGTRTKGVVGPIPGSDARGTKASG